MPKLVAGIVGAIIGMALAAVLWYVAALIVIPKGDGFTGYGQALIMLVLLPLALGVGAIWGAAWLASGVAQGQSRHREMPQTAPQRQSGFETLPPRPVPLDRDPDEPPRT